MKYSIWIALALFATLALAVNSAGVEHDLEMPLEHLDVELEQEPEDRDDADTEDRAFWGTAYKNKAGKYVRNYFGPYNRWFHDVTGFFYYQCHPDKSNCRKITWAMHRRHEDA